MTASRDIHNNTMVKIQHTWHSHYHPRPQRGGGEAKIGVHFYSTPPHRKSNIFLLYGCLYLLAKYFSPCGGLFGTFFLLWGPFSPCEGLSAPLFSMWGAFLVSWWDLLWAGAHTHYIYYNTFILKCINI